MLYAVNWNVVICDAIVVKSCELSKNGRDYGEDVSWWEMFNFNWLTLLKAIPECQMSVCTPGGLGSEVFAWGIACCSVPVLYLCNVKNVGIKWWGCMHSFRPTFMMTKIMHTKCWTFLQWHAKPHLWWRILKHYISLL